MSTSETNPDGVPPSYPEYRAPAADPAPVRDAATVVLLRDADEGPEAFTLTRATSMAFSAGATVFPGGRVDPGDDLPEQFWAGTDLDSWVPMLGPDPALARQLLAAAIRETFEECGVLLARPSCSRTLADPRDFEEERARLESRELSFAEFLAAHRLVPDVGLLRPLSRWITPVGEPRRYDTRFFLAALPQGQEPRQASGEASAVQWLDAATALEWFRDGSTFLARLSAAFEVPEVAVRLAEQPPGDQDPDLVGEPVEPAQGRLGLARATMKEVQASGEDPPFVKRAERVIGWVELVLGLVFLATVWLDFLPGPWWVWLPLGVLLTADGGKDVVIDPLRERRRGEPPVPGTPRD